MIYRQIFPMQCIKSYVCIYLVNTIYLYHIQTNYLYVVQKQNYIYNIYTIFLYFMYPNCLYQVQTKTVFSTPNLDEKVLPVPHEDKFSLPHIGKRFFFIYHVVSFQHVIQKKMYVYIRYMCIIYTMNKKYVYI